MKMTVSKPVMEAPGLTPRFPVRVVGSGIVAVLVTAAPPRTAKLPAELRIGPSAGPASAGEAMQRAVMNGAMTESAAGRRNGDLSMKDFLLCLCRMLIAPYSVARAAIAPMRRADTNS